MSNYQILKKLTFLLLFILLLGYLLTVGRNFLFPILLAILIAYLLYPLVYKLEQLNVPRVLAIMFSEVLAIAVLLGLIYFIYKQLGVFLNDIPGLLESALTNAQGFENFVEKKLEVKLGDEEEWFRGHVAELFMQGGGVLQDIFNATTNTLVNLGLMPVYTFLMLYYRNKLRHFIFKLVPDIYFKRTENIISEISEVTKKYMTGVVLVVLVLCVLNSVGLLIIGLQYALLFGILSALMNFIPYFGTLIGGAIPLIFTLLVQGSPQMALKVVILFLIIQFTENNILTPNITGGQVRINPLMTILGIVIGGTIWGVPGMILAVPLLGMLRIMCDHIPSLHPYAYLLGPGGTEQHSLSIDNIKQFFKSMFGSKK